MEHRGELVWGELMNGDLEVFGFGCLGVLLYEASRVYMWVTCVKERDRIYRPGFGVWYIGSVLLIGLASGALAVGVGPELGWRGVFVGYSVLAGLKSGLSMFRGGMAGLLQPPANHAGIGAVGVGGATTDDIIILSKGANLGFRANVLLDHFQDRY